MNIVNAMKKKKKKFQPPPALVITWWCINISGFNFVDRQCNKNMNNERPGKYKDTL